MEKETKNSMLSLDSLRKVETSLGSLGDSELSLARRVYYELGQLIYEDWQDCFGSVLPETPLAEIEEKLTLRAWMSGSQQEEG